MPERAVHVDLAVAVGMRTGLRLSYGNCPRNSCGMASKGSDGP